MAPGTLVEHEQRDKRPLIFKASAFFLFPHDIVHPGSKASHSVLASLRKSSPCGIFCVHVFVRRIAFRSIVMFCCLPE